jgi:hypothetical protein
LPGSITTFVVAVWRGFSHRRKKQDVKEKEEQKKVKQ